MPARSASERLYALAAVAEHDHDKPSFATALRAVAAEVEGSAELAARLREVLYPNGNTEHEWSPATLEAVAALVAPLPLTWLDCYSSPRFDTGLGWEPVEAFVRGDISRAVACVRLSNAAAEVFGAERAEATDWPALLAESAAAVVESLPRAHRAFGVAAPAAPITEARSEEEATEQATSDRLLLALLEVAADADELGAVADWRVVVDGVAAGDWPAMLEVRCWGEGLERFGVYRVDQDSPDTEPRVTRLRLEGGGEHV